MTGKHRYLGGEPYKLDFAGTDWVKFKTVNYSTDNNSFEQIGGSIEFCTDAPTFEINLGGSTAPFRLWCEEDGELRLVSQPIHHVDAANNHVIVDFSAISDIPTARKFRVDLGAGGAAGFFSGITTSVLHDVWRPAGANPIRCIVAGDSFVEGTTSDGVPNDVMGLSGLVNHMGWHLGLDDVWASGSGGTGWLRANGNRVALSDRFQRDVIDHAPDLAIIAMGVNDGEQNPGQVQTVVATWCAKFRQALPTSPLFIVAPWSPQGSGPLDIRTAIIAGAQTENSGRTFVIDPAVPGSEWQWPAPGHQGMTTGVGNGDWVVDNGGTHPSVAGHAYLGARLANAIREKLAA
ncbi:SGNH/GDSL hydrolase family protein [Aliirhizobium terrae]|uniref:SGNH/GDSL hydrolase family protein n=1 Tax=Terrirhizobium terrae TaxID=2926709 RepID=UPI0025764D8F|nr:SGNH/GDSL hydrolase family protein [Rhizobium sp. CC-CFT758]WJH39673.1 SGNH/GDSL hydrolase family protein [Rhizobium sp. CC-CFT758]